MKPQPIFTQLRPLLTLACSLFVLGSSSAATLEQVPNIPTAEVILARGDEAALGGGGSQATFGFRNNATQDPPGSEGTRGRGQSFVIAPSVPGSTFEISSLAVSLAGGAGTAIRPDGDLTLMIFEFDGAGATASAQADDTNTGSDWRSGTGASSGTILYMESFPIAAGTSFLSSNLLNITFDAGELQLDSDTAYAFFFLYTLDDVTGLNGDVTIAFDADDNAPDNAPGTLLNTSPSTAGFSSAANGSSVSRDLNYFITGTIVDPPADTPVITSSTPPTTDIISSSTTGTTDTALFDEDSPSNQGNHARGQLFSLPNGSGSEYEISALTIRKSTTQVFANDTITLRIFEGTQAQWDTGTGHSTPNDGDNYYVGTSVTPLFTQAFTLDGTITNDDYVTFLLDSPLVVNENSDFGFFITYEQSDPANPDRFRHREATTGGGRTSIVTTNHSTSPDRQIHYYLQGTPTGSSTASLTLGSPFQNRMILQRDKPFKVWGTTDPNNGVQVIINGHTVTGTADAQGNWEVELSASSAGGPHTLTVTSTGTEGSATATINDALFGDVWFCFGQSNMRWRFSNFSASWENFYLTEIAANDDIRYLRTIEDGSLTEQDSTGMTWLPNSSVGSWSAVASVFAYQVNQATNVPIAIIDSAWGSSSIEGWLPLSLRPEFPHFDEMMENYQSISEYRAGTMVATRATNGSMGAVYSSNEEAITAVSGTGYADGSQTNIFMRQRPNIIYNERVHPLTRYGIAGFVWYQGEANSSIIDSAQYRFTLPRMVAEYRERFGQGDLPFLGVQLPSYNTTTWPWFREAQDSLLGIPNAYVAVTIDTGATNNIHPSDKEEVGVRLALLAREHALGESIEGDSPRYASHSISGNEVILTFDHATGLTTTNGASPAGFELAGSDEVFHPATNAVISGNTITVSSTSEPAPIAVRYAWTATTHTFANTINGAAQPSGSPFFADTGLPLAPFRTDDWPLEGLTSQVPFGIVDSYSTPRDTTLTIPADGVLSNDFDLNFDPLQANLISPPSNGTLTLQSDGSFTYNPDEGFAGPDSFIYRASETNGRLNSPDTTVSLTVEGTPSSYYIWRNTIAWNPGDDETTGGDPDGDGVPNLLEFALGMNPLELDLSGLPCLIPTPSGADFDFNNAQTGVTYEVLLSTDLETWSEPAFATLDNNASTPVSIPSSEEDNGRLFVRLRVSETEE